MIHVFADYELDAELYELRRKGQRVKIEPRVFSLLAYLLGQRQRVVSRDELLAQLWPGEFVSDAALSYCVKEARKAVGDDGTRQRIIQTVHRRGFRFIAPAAESSGKPQRPSAPSNRGSAELAAGAPFVGRDAVMALLRQALADAGAAQGRVVLLLGEPGIGKTRITEELSRLARGAGVNVLLSRCHESEGAPSFWPWVQLLRAHVRSTDLAQLRRLVSTVARDVVHLVPELGERLATSATPTLADSAEARFQLFDHVTRLLQAAVAEQPLVLIIDDLHWADKPSLVLLQFLAREMTDMRLLVVGTYRDTDIGGQHVLTDALGDLARVSLCRRITLGGLEESDVARLVEHAVGHKPSSALVHAVYEETDGNPFFATEVARLLAVEPPATDKPTASQLRLSVPATVRETITRRLDRMSPACNRALRLASVSGREVALPVLAAAWRLEGRRGASPTGKRETLLRALDEARAARIVEDVPGGPGSVRFVHGLIRETLYEAIASGERARLHAAMAQALRAAHGDAPGPHLAPLAHHFVRAAALGDTRSALDASLRAAAYAAGQWAFEEAVAHYERAADLLAGDSSAGRRRTEIGLALGTNLWRAGDFDRARVVFRSAADSARACRSPALLARAALGFGGGFRGFNFGVTEPLLIDLLEEALQRLPHRDSSLRAQVMARLALALHGVPGSLPRRESLSRSAIDIAQRAGDRTAHIAALSSHHWATWAPDNLRDRLATAADLIEGAEGARDLEMALQGHRFHLIDSLEAGDMRAVDRDLAACAEIATRLRQPYYTWYVSAFRALRAFLHGAFEESEGFSQEFLRVGQRARSQNINQAFGAQMLALRREQGRVLEVEPVLRGLVEQFPSVLSWRCGWVYVLAELGREDETRAQFEHVARDDFAGLPRDAFWLVAMNGLGDVCAFLGDDVRAPLLYRLLEPLHDHMAVNVVGTCVSSVARTLGRLAATHGRWGDACRHFEAAIALESRLGARPLLAHSQHDYAEALLARGRPGDLERTVQLLGAARQTYDQLGMRTFLVQATASLSRARAASTRHRTRRPTVSTLRRG